MTRLFRLLLFVSLVSAPAALAQTPQAAPGDPLATALKTLFDGVKRNVAESAEKVPENLYSFKPTPEVRSFAELFGHVANSAYSYCSRAKGDKNPNQGNDFEKLTAKADLVKAVNDAFTYCDGVYGSMTDRDLLAPAQAGQAPAGKARTLITNISHTNEHYGNLVTYMRLKGIVPPSTARTQK